MQIHMISNSTCLRWQQERFRPAKFSQQDCSCHRPKQLVDQLKHQMLEESLFFGLVQPILWCCLYQSDLIPMSPSKYSGRSPTLPPAASPTFASSSTSFLIHSLGFHHIWLLGSGHKWQFCPQKKNVLFWFYSLCNNCELLSKINNLTVVDKMTGTWSRQVEVWRGRQTGARLVG